MLLALSLDICVPYSCDCSFLSFLRVPRGTDPSVGLFVEDVEKTKTTETHNPQKNKNQKQTVLCLHCCLFFVCVVNAYFYCCLCFFFVCCFCCQRPQQKPYTLLFFNVLNKSPTLRFVFQRPQPKPYTPAGGQAGDLSRDLLRLAAIRGPVFDSSASLIHLFPAWGRETKNRVAFTI